MMKNVDSQINMRYRIQGAIVFDPFKNEVTYGETFYKLAYSDAKVLSLLIAFNGAEVTRESIIEYAWQGRIVTEASLTTSISNLRKILRACDINEDGILTVPKIGYKLTLDVKALSSDDALLPDTNTVNKKTKKMPLISFCLAFAILSFTLISNNQSPLRSSTFISSEYKIINETFENKKYKILAKRNTTLPKYLAELVLLSPENSFIFFQEAEGIVNICYYFKNKSKTYTFEKNNIESVSEVIHDTINE